MSSIFKKKTKLLRLWEQEEQLVSNSSTLIFSQYKMVCMLMYGRWIQKQINELFLEVGVLLSVNIQVKNMQRLALFPALA